MRRVGVLIFPGFEVLDLYGPMEMLGSLKSHYKLIPVAQKAGPVASAQGIATVAEIATTDQSQFDILFVLGGPGTRDDVHNLELLSWITETAQAAELVMTVCTGAALLAHTGVLDGHRATTNKAAFDWVADASPNVQWQRQARWVEDDKFWTSSGVSAGIDMTLAVISHLQGREMADRVAVAAEYIWNDDPDNDPFSKGRTDLWGAS